jgi:exodeoxyribonuclease VIII
MKTTKVMVDLETLGTRPGSVITSIGATKFDENGPYGEPFYMRIDLQSCVDVGMLIDIETIKWWMKQSDEARSEFQKEAFAIDDVLNSFTEWLGYPSNVVELWGNGANFDNALLKAAYDNIGLKAPWAFWHDRCYRTLKAMYPHIKMPKRVGTHHNALDDAISQVNHLILLPCFQELCAAENQAAADAEQQLKLETF